MSNDYFARAEIGGRPFSDYLLGKTQAVDLFTLKSFCEYVQTMAGLLEPYSADYPVINTRELQAPFDPSPLEYKDIPGFSMVAFDRSLDYINEPFQFDLLHDPQASHRAAAVLSSNFQCFLRHLPQKRYEQANLDLGGRDITNLAGYPLVLRHLFRMDRGHVIAKGSEGYFKLLGIYASFPSQLNQVLKRFGFRIGKFRPADNQLYEQNRSFVYRYLMELHGFPIASERRTSAAMFCRQLSNNNENFFISVLGNSDRVITFLSSRGRGRWPLVEKIALIRVEGPERGLARKLEREGFFVDPKRGVLILKVTYTQHSYNPENIVEDRAMSVVDQEIIHPLTGRRLGNLDLLKTKRSRLVRLNDIVRGEFLGDILYNGQEVVYGTEDTLSRFKFLQAWLSKHRRAILNYTPPTFGKVCRALDSCLEGDESAALARLHPVVHHQLMTLIRDLKQEYQVLEVKRLLMGGGKKEKLTYRDRLARLAEFLSHERELITYQELIFRKTMLLCDRILDNPYFNNRYLNPTNQRHSKYERRVLELYSEIIWRRKRLEERYYRSAHATSAV